MTLKKFNESSRKIKKHFCIKGQSIFEYFILTTVIVAVVLSLGFFQDIQNHLKNAFNQAVEEMLE